MFTENTFQFLLQILSFLFSCISSNGDELVAVNGKMLNIYKVNDMLLIQFERGFERSVNYWYMRVMYFDT